MATTEKKKRHWLSRLSFGTVSLVLSALMVLAYLSVVVNPAKAWIFTLFGLLYPLVLPLTIGLFVWAVLRRSRMRGLLLAVLLPSFFFAGRYLQLRRHAPESEGPLKVITYNVGLFAHGDENLSRNTRADSLCRWLLRQNADLICLQEFYFPPSVSPASWLKEHFPGYKIEYYVLNHKFGHTGNVTLSRYPVVGKGKIDFEKSSNLALWTDIRLDSSTVRVYNCHFQSYNISLSNLVKKDGAVEETERKMRRSIIERPKQVAEVLRGMDNAPVRSLVVGDFNDNPLSYTYYRLLRGRKDSFVKAGKGFGATYRTLWPLLRIDYILYPPDLEAITYQVPHVKYSDHYPIIATYHETGRNTP